VQRYFTSHGPATLQDFAWWTGLTLTDAKAGVEMAKPHLASVTLGDQTYWLSPVAIAEAAPPAMHLLPPFDEYLVAYKDRHFAFDGRYEHNGMIIMTPAIISRGKVVGTWRRAVGRGQVRVTLGPGTELSGAGSRAFNAAAQRYAAFLDLKIKPAEV
jgi:hypothetical protein